jgi:hypothetical protein
MSGSAARRHVRPARSRPDTADFEHPHARFQAMNRSIRS